MDHTSHKIQSYVLSPAIIPCPRIGSAIIEASEGKDFKTVSSQELQACIKFATTRRLLMRTREEGIAWKDQGALVRNVIDDYLLYQLKVSSVSCPRTFHRSPPTIYSVTKII